MRRAAAAQQPRTRSRAAASPAAAALALEPPRLTRPFFSMAQWYSAEDWLPAAVDAVAARVQAASGGAALHVLDAGVGTSPCLFALAALRPERYAALHGVDFAPAAVEFLQRRALEAAANGTHGGLKFWAADARTLHGVPDTSVDVLLDKGCLDCFVTGDGGAHDVAAYLEAVARVLRGPNARVLLLAVNAADVPRLLATGEIAPDAHAGGGGRSGIAWYAIQWSVEATTRCEAHCIFLPLLRRGADKAALRPAAGAWTQRLWVEETVAFAEKHMLVCAPQPPPQGAPSPALRCHECGRVHAWAASGGPARASCTCGNKLRRFALS